MDLKNAPPLSLFQKRCLSMFSVVFFAVFTWLFISLCFFNNSTYEFDTGKQMLSFGLIATLSFVAFYILRKIRAVQNTIAGHFTAVLVSSMVVLLILQIILIMCISVPIGWDCGVIVDAAFSQDMSSYSEYFSIYPNNIFLLFFFRIVGKILYTLPIDNPWLVLSLLNALAVNAAILFSVLSMKKIFGNKSAAITLFFAILLLGFSPWLIVPYSDTFSMPFVVLSFFLYLQLNGQNSVVKKIILGACIGLSACIGYLIKPSALIPLIAIILLHLLCTNFSKKGFLKNSSFIPAALAAFFLLNSGFGLFVSHQTSIPINPDKATPMSHFFMMGLKEVESPPHILYGTWNEEDVALTCSFSTKEKKIAANKQVIQDRLQEYGLAGYLNHLNNKARWITSEGSFYWGIEGNFALFDKMRSPTIKEMIDPKGKYFDIYNYTAQGIWIFVMLLLVIPVALRKKEVYHKELTMMRCTLFGILCFILLFEGRSRYMINHLPFFVMLASYGFQSITDQIQRHFAKGRKTNELR